MSQCKKCSVCLVCNGSKHVKTGYWEKLAESDVARADTIDASNMVTAWLDTAKTKSIVEADRIHGNADKLVDNANKLADYAQTLKDRANILGKHLYLEGRIWPLN
jgi:hypothetical protein